MERNYFADKFSQTKIQSLGVSLNTYYCGDKIAYKMYVGGKLLFKGADYKPSSFYNWDSLEANLSLLGFLCVGIDDTDEEYFKYYSEAQMGWAKNWDVRDALSCYISDIENVDSDDIDSVELHAESLKLFKHKTF